MPEAGGPALTPLQRAFLALEETRARLATVERAAQEPIAIVGLGCRAPGGVVNPEGFWRLIADGVDAIGPVPSDRWDHDALYDPDPDVPGRIATRNGGFVDGIDRFDPGFFSIAPREAESMDPQQRMLLEVCWEALENAGQAPDRLENSATGVFVGATNNDYMYLALQTGDHALLDAHFASGISHSILSGRLSYLLGLQGPSLTIDTSCSSSLVAVHLAVQALRSGDCRMALAGGVNLILSPEVFMALSRARMLAPDGRCKTFDASADGYARSEGCGVVVLKRLSDATADGDRILAVIRGNAVNQDGPSSSLTAPNGPAQEAVIREALRRAGVAPAEVGLIEAHGTGTQLGDPLEVQALRAVFEAGRNPDTPLMLGSVKTNIGHAEAAAGILGLIKVVLALCHRTIPAQVHFQKPSPHIPWGDFAVRVPQVATPWAPIGDRRIAGVSSFGFSGTNAHLIVEGAPEVTTAVRQPRPGLLALSARDPVALAELAGRYGAALDASPDAALPDICRTANAGRAHFAHRATILAHSTSDLRAGLAEVARGGTVDSVATDVAVRGDPPRVAFLFTGQGSQYAGMAKGLYDSAPAFRAALDRCAKVLAPELDKPLLDLLFPADARSAQLDETGYTQPALFAVEYALAELWRSWGITPNVLIGHSVGEYVAACLAGVFSLEDGLRLIAARGRLMQSLPAGGAMGAIFAPETVVAAAVASHSAQVAIAALNGPAQTVVSGAADAVQAICDQFKAKGVRCQLLPVSHAFHSPLVEPVLDAFEREAAKVKFSSPRLRLISNLTGRPATSEITQPSYWRRHMRDAVRFVEGLSALAEAKPAMLIEIGPHSTLLSYASAVFTVDPPRMIPSLRKGQPDLEQMLKGVSTAYLAGAAIDWRGVEAGAGGQIVGLPTYPFQRQRYWFRAGSKRAAPRARSGSSPLLGEKLRLASSGSVYEARVGADVPGFVRQHRVQGRIVLPATAYLGILLAGAPAELHNEAVVVEGVTIDEAMVLDDDGAERIVQTRFEPGRDGGLNVSISSVEESGQSDSWIQHVTARVRASDPSTLGPAIGLESARAACPESVEVTDFYQRLKTLELDFGPGFRTVTRLWRGQSQALGEIVLSEFAADAAAYHIHPALLDGCFQVMAATLSRGDERPGLYLPVGVGALTLRKPSAGPLWSHVVARPGVGDVRHADIVVYDADGEVVASLDDVQFQRVSRAALGRLVDRWLEDVLYETRWRDAPLADAGADGQASVSKRDWLLLADAQGVAEDLAAKLRARGDRTTLVRAGAFTSSPDVATVDPTSAADYRRLLADLRSQGRKISGVVHAWSLDAPAHERLSGETVAKAQDTGAIGAMLLAQALVAETPPPRLWIVTRGGQEADPSDRPLAPLQALGWGLGKALALEHPELGCVCVDLEPRGGADGLLRELAESGVEAEVALRSVGRRVARLASVQRKPTGPVNPRPASFRLAPTTRGTFEQFTYAPFARRAPGPGEVEIAIEATGLNFKDVLNVLDMYPGNPGPLGSECAGRVVGVGPGVEHVAPGDDVLAVTSGSFASHVTVNAKLVQRRPVSMSVEEAACFPIAYLTANFCLSNCGRIKAGDRVLIHAAAGGVGMAAVRLAQRAGAEIFATAGSDWKRDLLRSLGVRHIFNSRNDSFAEDVLAATGGKGVDLILNSLGGDLIEPTFRVLADGGRFVEIGKRGIKSPEWVAALGRGLEYFIIDLGEQDPTLMGNMLERLVNDLATGKLASSPRHVFALDDAPRAFTFMAQARHAGRIVVRHGPPSATIRNDGSYLVTGGLSGLGLMVAKRLAERGAGRLILIGRRGATPEAAAAIDELKAHGTQVIAAAVDVADEAALATLLGRIRADGLPLRGVVHCAGVLADASLLRQDVEKFRHVLQPKVGGGWLLDRLTRSDPLDFFVLFSSVAGLFGSPGQTNYAAANAFLDMLAHTRVSAGLPAISINWGAWTEVGMAAAMGDRMADRGLGALTMAQGLTAFERLLDNAAAQAAVFPVDWSRFLARSGAERRPFFSELAGAAAAAVVATATPQAQAAKLLQQIADAPAPRRRRIVAEFVRERVSRALGMGSSGVIDPQTPFGELGLDSLLSVELRNVLGTAFGQTFPPTLLFDYPTIDALTDYLLAEVLDVAGKTDGSDKAGEPETVSTAPISPSLVASVEDLSDDEVDRRLAARMSKRNR